MIKICHVYHRAKSPNSNFFDSISFLSFFYSKKSSSLKSSMFCCFVIVSTLSLAFRAFCLSNEGIYEMKFLLQCVSYCSSIFLNVTNLRWQIKGGSLSSKFLILRNDFFLWKYVRDTLISFILMYLKNTGYCCYWTTFLLATLSSI